MAASKSAAAVVSDALQLTIECGICTEVKELRMLPCQHMMCLQCLERIIADGRRNAMACCSFCKIGLTLPAVQYPICRFTSNLQADVDRITEVLQNYHLTPAGQLCQTGDCKRHIDMYCTTCHTSLCFRCSRGKCVETGEKHSLTDFEEMLQLCKAKFESWTISKESKIAALTEQYAQLGRSIKEAVTNASEFRILEVMEAMSAKKQQMQNVSKRRAEEKAVLEKYQKGIVAVTEADYITLVEQLTVDEDEKITLGQCEVVQAKPCYYITETASGQLLLGRLGGFDVCDKTGVIVKPVGTDGGHITCIQYYNNHIYVLCKVYVLRKAPTPGTKRQVIVFDSRDYREVRRWVVPKYKYISQLAVTNNKVYVSDPGNSQICVYSTEHASDAASDSPSPPESYIKHPTFNRPEYLSVSQNSSVIVSDWRARKVYKLSGADHSIIWTSAAVKNPRGVSCDTHDNVMVWSGETQSIFVLDADTGCTKAELKHEKFTELTNNDNIYSMCIMNQEGRRVLWAAAREKGLLKFTII